MILIGLSRKAFCELKLVFKFSTVLLYHPFWSCMFKITSLSYAQFVIKLPYFLSCVSKIFLKKTAKGMAPTKVYQSRRQRKEGKRASRNFY